MNVMNIKWRTRTRWRALASGFTLLETLIATAIASIIITSALGVVASIYFSQKRVQFSHDFYAESRFMMERIAQTIRNNTLDYDRYFVEYGPAYSECNFFDANQVVGASPVSNDATEGPGNRAEMGYVSIFYWDTNSDGTQDRNLGGRKLTGNVIDNCTKAWSANWMNRLFLINSGRSMRIEIRNLPDPDYKIAMSRQLGADTDNDGLADVWGPLDNNGDGNYVAADGDIEVAWSGTSCELTFDEDADNSYEAGETFAVVGDASSEDWCDQAHNLEDISPFALQVNDLQFMPNPKFDPFLAFRNEAAQVHPQVFVAMNLELRNPDSYGFAVGEEPTIDFQTSVSSRVFGDIRR